MSAMNDLSPERWREIDQLFAEALDRPSDERTAFLRHACGSDPALYHTVNALLEQEAEAVRVLGESVSQFAEPLLPHLEAHLDDELAGEDLVGRRIGPYRITRELGRGGMGVVYRAERADGQFEKTVALKIIKRGMDTDEVLRRFRYERQVLAALEHPGIARLLDGGVTEPAPSEAGGRPYLVMEYARGQPITAYCDAHEFDVDARLRLFVEVCEAVQYAHRNLVVHRDLKPSNILVKEEGVGGEHGGSPLLLDFGIAKLLTEGAEGAEGAVLSSAPRTRTGVRVMTPEYASPEQITGAPITTASDVYQLGVVLYELLTGRRPYALAGKAPAEAERLVLEQPPERPSTAAMRPVEHRRPGGTTETMTPEAVSSTRRTGPHRLRRRLKGDLDTIVLKALRKEPERRYASAEALLEDIKRHLAGRPVTARPDTPWYRARTFVRRHRVGVAAAALVLLSLLGGLGAALWQADRAARERDTARAVSAFLENLFAASDPLRATSARLDTLRVRDFLARGADRVQGELAAQPAVQAHLLNVLGNVHANLGLHEEARPLLQEALRTRRALHGNTHPEVAKSLHDLGRLHFAAEAYDRAEPYYRRALELRVHLLGTEHPDVAATQRGLAWALSETGGYAEAERLFRNALALQRRLHPNAHPDLHDAVYGLATVLVRTGDFAEAERYFREAVTLARNLPGETRAVRIAALDDLATILHHSRRYAEAEPLYREVLALQKQLLGERHPALVRTRTRLAQLFYSEGDYAAALPFALEALARAERLHGEQHLLTSDILYTLARLRAAEHRYAEAEALCRRALRIRKDLLGAGHPTVIVAELGLGKILTGAGRYAAAEQLFRRAMDKSRARYDAPHPYTALSLAGLAQIAAHRGDAAAAEALYRESLALHRRALRAGHPLTAEALLRLGRLLLAQERAVEAEPLLREALAIRRETWGTAYWRTAAAQSLLGAALAAQGRYEAAEPLLLSSHLALRDAPDHPPEPAREALRRLTALYDAWGKPEQAARYRPLLAAQE